MKRAKQYQDVIAGIILLVISAAYYSGSFFETSGIMQVEYGPDFMPKIYAVLMGLLSIAPIVTGIKKAKKYAQENHAEDAVDIRSVVTVVLSLVCIGLYIFLIEAIGFLFATAVYLFAQAWLLSQKKNYLQLILFCIIGSVLTYLLFVNVLGLMLPKGIFGF